MQTEPAPAVAAFAPTECYGPRVACAPTLPWRSPKSDEVGVALVGQPDGWTGQTCGNQLLERDRSAGLVVADGEELVWT